MSKPSTGPSDSVAPSSTLAWAEEELGQAGLPDARLDARLVKLLCAFMASPEASVSRACGNWPAAKAAYRFFDNKNVDPDVILERHRKSALARAEGEPIVLAIGDTTMLDYTDHLETQGLGPLADLKHQGMLVQPVLLVTPKRVPLGVAALDTWVRQYEGFGSSDATKKDLPIDEKESGKWLNSIGEAERFQQDVGEKTMVVSVFDREGDVFEVIGERAKSELRSHLLVRAKTDRSVDHPQRHLWSTIEAMEPAATIHVVKPRVGREKPREATLSIRFCKLKINVPRGRKQPHDLVPVEITAVYANEDNPPDGADAISWMLLTTLPVATAEDAVRIVEWYACRWSIEVLFKILKSGCATEERQLETADRLKRCLSLDVIVAWRILYLTMIGRDTPDLPCSVVFEDYEWKSIYVFVHKSRHAVPKATPTLREVTRLIGRLGGHLGRKGDGEPGPMSLWRGLQRLPDIAEMWQAFETELS